MSNSKEDIIFKSKIFEALPYSILRDRNRLRIYITLPLLAMLGMMYIGGSNVPEWVVVVFFILSICWLVLMFARFGINDVSSETGKDIIFRSDNIQFGDRVIDIGEIGSIQLILTDYFGKLEYRNRDRDYRPISSQGFQNEIKIVTKSGVEYIASFQLLSKESKLEIEPFIFKLIKCQIISEEDGLRFFEIKKEKEKQAFSNRLDSYIG